MYVTHAGRILHSCEYKVSVVTGVGGLRNYRELWVELRQLKKKGFILDIEEQHGCGCVVLMLNPAFQNRRFCPSKSIYSNPCSPPR